MALKTKYAQVSWNATDIREKRPDWSIGKCEEWLSDNESQIVDDMIERGWDSIDTLLDMTEENEDEE